mgnify:CR=1 FL=1
MEVGVLDGAINGSAHVRSREASGLGLDGLGEHGGVLGLLASQPRATAQLVLGVGVVTSRLAALLAYGALMRVQVLEREGERERDRELRPCWQGSTYW